MKRAAVYCRTSRDAEQEGLGVARQEEDCRALVAREGWTLVEPPYVDNDISASTLSKKTRPAYEAMLAAARAGQVDVIVAVVAREQGSEGRRSAHFAGRQHAPVAEQRSLDPYEAGWVAAEPVEAVSVHARPPSAHRPRPAGPRAQPASP